MNPSLTLPGEKETGRPPLASYRANLERTVRSALDEETQAFIHPHAYEEIIQDLASTGDLDLAQKRIACHWNAFSPEACRCRDTVVDHLTVICLAYWKLHRAEKFTFAARP